MSSTARPPTGSRSAAAGKTGGGKLRAGAGKRDGASVLARLGLERREELLLHLPLRYEDETRLTPIARLLHGSSAQIQARVLKAEVTGGGARRRTLQVQVADDSGELQLRFLHFYPSQLAQLVPGRLVRAFGELRVGLFGREMVHPRYRIVSGDTPLPDRLTPVYPTVAGLGQAPLRREISLALDECRWTDTLPAELLAEVGAGGLPSLVQALHIIHHPPPGTDLQALHDRQAPACQRVILEELVAQQLSLRHARQLRAGQLGRPLTDRGAERKLLQSLPFELTGAQQRVRDEIAADLARAQPMNRLLQGDVGSGKTVIAALAAMVAVGSGWQATLMAPTEILARQHYERLSPWLETQGVRVGWLAGSLTPAAKRQIKQAVSAGEVDVLIGTHALIEESVVFPRLALAIVDEQHRFGVAQRLALRGGEGEERSWLPHQLMMTATPIPRTLAMTFYADLDVSVIDELPPGRQPVTTKLIADARRDQVVENVGRWVADGKQAYWVCPLVEESEVLDLQNVIDTRERLQTALPSVRIGLVHGRLPAAEKDATMAAFKAGDLDLLVATTVIEVGVDVPNASLMVIEHAERFGLSQLHQLRGRVGRGSQQSLCVLLYRHPAGQIAKQRLATMHQTQDGFEIARRDLELRGPGELLGARQSGAMLLRFADLSRDAPLVETAHALADRVLAEHPEVVATHLARWLGQRERFLDA
ncbi:MAG: ATP-dependent DNA helicase RecG [Lautropia sp.]|nr:ATP-dependent DNA helicase RecG [Lautropia sp.]